MTKIITAIRHAPAISNDKWASLTPNANTIINAVLPIINETMDYPSEFWISTLARSEETALVIRRSLYWMEAPIREFNLLDTIGEEAKNKVPGCEEIFAHVQKHLASYVDTSVGAALLASPGGEEYMRSKARRILRMAQDAEGDIIIIAHENLAAPLAWEALGTDSTFAAIGGELRYVE